MSKKIYPSLMNVPENELSKIIRELEPYCDGFHNDIMDNKFVPNKTGSVEVTRLMTEITQKPLWTHLMVANPEAILQSLTIRSGDIISFHIEVTHATTLQTIKLIQSKGGRASIAVKPQTPLETVHPYLPVVDHILIMSVEPGFSGQQFLTNSYERLNALVAQKISHKLTFAIGIDGGVNEHNIAQLAKHGCDDFAASSAIFGKPNPIEALQNLRSLI